jgi:CMP/dCMP kinase
MVKAISWIVLHFHKWVCHILVFVCVSAMGSSMTQQGFIHQGNFLLFVLHVFFQTFIYIAVEKEKNLVLVLKMGSNETNGVKKILNDKSDVVYNDGKRKVSIVISGWPAVGKTTIAESIAKDFNLKLCNGGDILKTMAFERGYSSSLNHDWWDTEEALVFMNERNSDPNFDKEVDNRLIEIVNGGNVVITSYTLPWIADATINFWLQGSVDNRAKRMAMRDNISVDEAKKIVLRRDNENKLIYKKIYNFDFGEKLDVFDFAFNTDLLPLESLVDLSKKIVKDVLSS